MKEQFLVTMHVTHEMIYKTNLSALEAKAKKCDVLMSQLSCYTYRGTDLGNTILGCGASLVPQCGYSGISTVLQFAVGSVLANTEIPIDVELLVNSMPSKDIIQNLVTKHTIDTCILTQGIIRKNMDVYSSLDKGSNKGNKNLAKYI